MDTKAIFLDLVALNGECNERRIRDFTKWSADFMFHLSHHPVLKDEISNIDVKGSRKNELTYQQRATLRLIQALMDNEEYERVFQCTQEIQDDNQLLRFLHFYGQYWAIKKHVLETTVDLPSTETHLSDKFAHYHRLNSDMELLLCHTVKGAKAQADPFLLYLYGLVLKELNQKKRALAAFVKSIKLLPRLWPSWFEASKLLSSYDEIFSSNLPNHWMKNVFLCETYINLQFNEDALQICKALNEIPGLGDSPYVQNQQAIVNHNLQDLDVVVALFNSQKRKDPYRLENMDVFSNCLFVKNMRSELAALAHHCVEVSKYCPQTCIVVGNYYSIRGEHEKAIISFQRVLKLDSQSNDAWTLMGHEFMELKNPAAASIAYRKAIDIDPKDYRAWYGLGQLYDVLNMPKYAMYYYNRAQRFRPRDPRMIIALGEMYEKQNKVSEAIKCYEKAYLMDEIEGRSALLQLGKLFKQLKNIEHVAVVYSLYLMQIDCRKIVESTENLLTCYRFLAEYHADRHNLDEAHYYAHLCLDDPSTKDEARGILRRISQLRGKEHERTIPVAETS